MAGKIKYTDEDICNRIREVMDGLGIDRFPSVSELNAYTGSQALRQLIRSRGGAEYFANMIGTSINNTYKFGTGYEPKALEDIKAETGLDCWYATEKPYDIICGNGIRVDVKVAKPTKSHKSTYYEVGIHKKNPTCDLYQVYLLNEDGSIYKRLIIPVCVTFGKINIGIGENSKWDFYIEKWDFFKMYDGFYGTIISDAPKEVKAN